MTRLEFFELSNLVNILVCKFVISFIFLPARFNFTLAEDLKEAASDEKVKSELGSKISRERIRDEIDLMMSDKHPVKPMCAVYHILKQDGILHVLLTALCSEAVHLKLQDEQQRLYLYSALFVLLQNTLYMDKRSKKVPVTSYILRDSLKLKGDDGKMVGNIHDACEKFVELVLLFESNVVIGTRKEELEDEYLEIPTDLVKRVFADLDGVWKLEPLLHGDGIMEVMNVRSGSPLVGDWERRLWKWQLAHPKETTDECIEWMKHSQSKRQKLESST